MQHSPDGTKLLVPVSSQNQDPIVVPLEELAKAESRVNEVRFVNETTGRELAGHFNEASSLVGRLLAQIKFEILKAESAVDKAKSDVIIDQAPTYALKLKEAGMKMSEDIRAAMVVKDPIYNERLDILHGLIAVQALLNEKAKTFSKAYYSCDAAVNGSRGIPGRKINGHIGMTFDEPQKSMMGRNEVASGLDPDILALYSNK